MPRVTSPVTCRFALRGVWLLEARAVLPQPSTWPALPWDLGPSSQHSPATETLLSHVPCSPEPEGSRWGCLAGGSQRVTLHCLRDSELTPPDRKLRSSSSSISTWKRLLEVSFPITSPTPGVTLRQVPAAPAWQEGAPALCVGSAAGTPTPKPRGRPVPAETGDSQWW